MMMLLIGLGFGFLLGILVMWIMYGKTIMNNDD